MLNRALSFREIKDREIIIQILYRILPSLDGEDAIVTKRWIVRLKKEIEDSDSIMRKRRMERRNRGGRYDL